MFKVQWRRDFLKGVLSVVGSVQILVPAPAFTHKALPRRSLYFIRSTVVFVTKGIVF